MRTLFSFLPAVVCMGGMFLCMRMMMGGHKSTSSTTPDQAGASTPDSASELTELREELARLRAERPETADDRIA